MRRSRHSSFTRGMVLGMTSSLLAGAVALYLLSSLDLVVISLFGVPQADVLIAWCERNLGLSIVPFAITLGLYTHSLHSLHRRLNDNAPLEEISQLEHLNDVWISLFFGIGVIWTAIGMRSALLFALGDPDIATQAGASAVLNRLVEGGILTALTTTIVGGVGGYLMRVLKSSMLGIRLHRYYESQDQQHACRVENMLSAIRKSVDQIGARTLCSGQREP